MHCRRRTRYGAGLAGKSLYAMDTTDAIAAVDAMLADLVPEVARQAISERLWGRNSAPITLLRLLLTLGEPAHVVAVLGRVVEYLVTACTPLTVLYQRATAMQ